MLRAPGDAPADTAAPRLLVPPSPLIVPSLPQEAALVLDLFATITAAPSAIPPDLWDIPLETLTADCATVLLNRICTHLTPRIPFLSWEVLDWEEDTDALHSFYRIPVVPIGLDTCNGDVIGTGAVFTWVGALCDFAVEELVYPLPQDVPPDLDMFDLVPALTNWYPGHPLAGLVDMIEVLDHRTGTFFLDACPACWEAEQDEGTEWDDENLAWLEQDATRTHVIMDRIDALEAWVAEDPTRIAEVWQALLEAHAQHADADPRPKTLMEVWGIVPQEATDADMDPTVLEGVTL